MEVGRFDVGEVGHFVVEEGHFVVGEGHFVGVVVHFDADFEAEPGPFVDYGRLVEPVELGIADAFAAGDWLAYFERDYCWVVVVVADIGEGVVDIEGAAGIEALRLDDTEEFRLDVDIDPAIKFR